MSNKYCARCGASLGAGENFCASCQANVEQSAMNSSTSKASGADSKESVWRGDYLVGNNSLAAVMPGEMTFIQPLPAMGGLVPEAELGPFKYLFSGVWRTIKNLKTVYRNKKSLALVSVISCVWLVLLTLPALGVNFSALNWLNFLTFAQGGASGGVPGLVGGLIGKGLLAYFFTVLPLPVFSGRRPFNGIGSGVRNIFASLAVKEKSNLPLLLGGAGIALVCYNFLTVDNSLQNSMAGIAACLLALRALANNGGFLRNFITSLINKPGKGRITNASAITRFMAGWAAGFALGIPLSATGISKIGYLTGIVIIAAAVALKFVSGRAKEVQEG